MRTMPANILWLEHKLRSYHINKAAIEQITAEIDDLKSLSTQSYLPGYAPAEPADKVADRTHKILALERKRARTALDVRCVDSLREAVKTHKHMCDVLDNYVNNGSWDDFAHIKHCNIRTIRRWRITLISLAAQIWQGQKN